MGWVRIDQSVWKDYVYPPVFTSPGFVYKDGRLRFDRVAGDTTSGSYNLTYKGANPAPDKTLKIRITVEEYRSTASSYYQPAQFSNYQASPSYVVTKNTAVQASSGAVLSFAPRIVSDENYAGTWLPSYRSSIVVNNATSGDEHYVHLIEVWDPDQSGTPPPPSGGGGVTIQTRDNNASLIPKPSHPVADGKPMDRIWYDALQKLASKTVSESRVVDIVQSQIPPPSDNATKIMQGAGIEVSGSQKDGYFVSLRQLINTEAGTALYKFTRDDFGRVEGTESADTDDLSEGATNLYHTPERAQDAAGAAIAAGTGDGVSLAYDDVANAINATNTDKGSVAVAAHEAATDPHPQYVTSTEAEAYADAAAASAAAAEAARDAAQLSAGVYPDTAAGLAATTSGQYFSVPSADSAEYLILYKNNAGSAVEVKRYPSAAAVLEVADKLLDTNASIFQVADSDGNVAVDFKSPVTVAQDGAVETDLARLHDDNAGSDFMVVDADGNAALRIKDGKLYADLSMIIPPEYDTGGTYDFEVNHLFVYGQSISVGQATPAISTAQRYDNLMFTRGMRPQYDYPAESAATWYAGLVPAVESNSTENTSLAETPCMGAGDAVKELIRAEAGIPYSEMGYQLLLSAPGYGALTITQLSKGSAHFSRMVEQATYGAALSAAAGKTYAVQAVAWLQGASDYLSGTAQASYETALNALVADINADVKAASGQSKSIPVFVCQVASHKKNGATSPSVALAQLAVETANSLAYIATPMYHFEYQDVDNNHLTPISSRWVGAYMGLAYKRVVIDGVDWKPLKPTSATRSGSVARIAFHVPHGRLVFDTNNVAANTNYGFELVDSGGAPLTISSVSIASPNVVKIVASGPIPAGAKIRYAWSGTDGVGPASGPRGNLRDTQGDFMRFDPAGINKPMHNWCVIFEKEL